MRVLITGDSHTGALERGRAALAASGTLPAGIDWDIRPMGSGALMSTGFWENAGDHADITLPAYRRRVPRLPPDGVPPDVIALSIPLWFSRVLRGFAEDGLTFADLDDGGRPVSDAMFRRMVLSDAQASLDLAAFLRGLNLRVLAIEPPGVFRDNRFLLAMPARRLLSFVERHGTVVTAALAERGVTVVRRPPETLDSAGFTQGGFRLADPTDKHHANAEYGALMLARIAAQLADADAAPETGRVGA